MKKLINKIKGYIFKPLVVGGEDIKIGALKTTKPEVSIKPTANAMRHGDRKRYFTNYNAELLNRISEIKSTNS